MKILAARARERHRLEKMGQEVDPLLGLDWDVLVCPTCGRRVQICWDPFKKLTLRPGSNDLTAEDVERILELSKAGRSDEARAIMAREPGHYYYPGDTISDVRLEVGAS